jgi:deazaflavin-dependent oxidoreductase (nitroreductase family)
MSALSAGMNLGGKLIEALPKQVQPRVWQAMQASHLGLFRASGGRLGAEVGSLRILFLHHLGAKTGARRTSPLLYVEDGKNLAIIASKGGNPKHPAWFHNLKANPDTEVEMKGGRRMVHAREARGAERERIWKKAAKAWPDYDRYQRRAPHRKIPVVVLEPRD